MSNIFFVIFRRMRRPLISLLLAYVITILGLVLIPGQDADGNPWRMDFFHAFYFVSFMSTTIGFGEIPYEFTEAQRFWVTFALYANVVVWLYAIGNVLSLLQDRAFQQAIIERRFSRRIRHLREPFYIICGYGETGHALVPATSPEATSIPASCSVSASVPRPRTPRSFGQSLNFSAATSTTTVLIPSFFNCL